MGRIVTMEGRKYEIADATVCIPFTDADGKYYEFDQFMFHNPLFHEAYKFTTILSVMKWWYKNRDELMPLIRENDYSPHLWDRILMYFDYLSRYELLEADLETAKDTMSGTLRRRSIKFVFPYAHSTSNILVETEESEVQRVDLNFMYLAQVEVLPHISIYTEDMWTKHYNYSFRMNPDEFNWFRSVNKEDSVMFGMELEISSKLSTYEIQTIVRDVEPKQEPFFIFKQDSSISGKYRNALELVTVPCTPRYLRKNWKIFFQKLERLCRAKGLEVGDVVDTSGNLSNGLHIHVSRDSFLDKSHFNKFLTSWNQWNKSVVSLFNEVSCRPTDYTKNSYCRISRSHDGTVLARRLKGLSCNDRMSVAHDSTGKTIEVRLFQGIFDLTHIMRCVSFTEAVFEFSQAMGYSNFDSRFVKSISQFIHTKRKYASLYSVFDKVAAK